MNETIDRIPLVALELAEKNSTKRLAGKLVARKVGNRVEVSLDELTLLDPILASKAKEVWDLQKSYFIDKSFKASKAVKIKRNIIISKQVDNQSERKDLKAEISKLLKTEAGYIVKEILSANPDFDKITEELKKYNGTLHRDGVWSKLTISLPARQSWDEDLGGFYSPGEIEREFVLTINHSPWRDRKNRRLVALEVSAVEVWVTK